MCIPFYRMSFLSKALLKNSKERRFYYLNFLPSIFRQPFLLLSIQHCWSLSVPRRKSSFYHNGQLIGIDNIDFQDDDLALQDSDIMYNTSFIFGQEPDCLGSCFEKSQAFIGDLSEFNIWNYTLEDSVIASIAICNSSLQGNIISWKKSNMILKKSIIKDVSDGNIFCAEEYRYAIFPIKVKFPEAKETCVAHGGILATPKSANETLSFLSIVR